MMIPLLALSLSLAHAGPGAAAGPAESAPAAALQALASAGSLRARLGARALRAVSGQDAPAPVHAAQQRYVTLRGFVSLQGSAFVPARAGAVQVTVQGNVQLQDDSGRSLDGIVTVSDWVTCFVSGNFLNGTARPWAQVQLYDNGRYLGMVRVDGFIPVSGFLSGSWANVQGSGWVQGSGMIDAPGS